MNDILNIKVDTTLEHIMPAKVFRNLYLRCIEMNEFLMLT